MGTATTRTVALCCAAGIFLTALVSPQAGASEVGETWREAVDKRSWRFPGDHGSHPDFRTEWWYFTGNVTSDSGRPLGYQLTFFRTGIRDRLPADGNRWSLRDLYLAHFTITDVEGDRFLWFERSSRAGPGLAGAREGALDLWLFDWTAAQNGDVIRLSAREEGAELSLELSPRKPPVLHGRRGISRKGEEPGQASYYYSLTNLKTEGTLQLPGGEMVRVKGRSWFDHEFGSNQLAQDQKGWDWFGLHLSDGREIMVYRLRKVDGTLEPTSSGTLVEADGTGVHLELDDLSVDPTGTWISPASGGTYPSGWRIRIPSAGVDIDVVPALPNQELVTERTAGVIYWEGAVTVRGRSEGEPVTGGGYAELTGYAGSIGGLF
ncbi:MAG: carotenoid 1,2-hydratase [bacterium]|nr:MAG: carotenoid 1,2-hydratase [bacterium]